MYGSGRLLLSIKKEVSGTFPFTCPVTVLRVSYRRRLNLCIALSSSPPGHPGLPAATCIYIVGLLPVKLNVPFDFGPPKINGSNSKLSLLWLHNLERTEKNYENINTTVSFSVLRSFRSTGYLLHIIAHERMHLLSINTKEDGTQSKTHVPSPVLFLCTYS